MPLPPAPTKRASLLNLDTYEAVERPTAKHPQTRRTRAADSAGAPRWSCA
jgi:hypothetical protein